MMRQSGPTKTPMLAITRRYGPLHSQPNPKPRVRLDNIEHRRVVKGKVVITEVAHYYEPVVDKSRYKGDVLRADRKRNGVGRPPRALKLDAFLASVAARGSSPVRGLAW